MYYNHTFIIQYSHKKTTLILQSSIDWAGMPHSTNSEGK